MHATLDEKSKEKNKLGEADAGLNTPQREEAIRILNVLLSDEYVIYTKTLKYHWNIVSHHFASLHKFLEEQYEELEEVIDEATEWVRKVNGKSFGTLGFGRIRAAYKTARKTPGEYPSDTGMLADLLNDH